MASAGQETIASNKVAVIAGGGAFPAFVIRSCREQKRPFFVLALKGITDPETVRDVPHDWVRMGNGGRAVRIFRREGIRDLMMVGSIHRPTVIQFFPDFYMIRAMIRIGWGAIKGGDDALIRAILRDVEKQGFNIVPVESVVPDLLAPEGVYGRIEPDRRARGDIAAGVKAAREVGARDVGQGAVVEQGEVIATEDSGGTDAMLRRIAARPRTGPGGVLVKVLKPGQQRKVDLPTIGTGTVAAAAEAGLRGIAVEAGHAIVIDRKAVAAAADEAGLFVVGVDAGS